MDERASGSREVRPFFDLVENASNFERSLAIDRIGSRVDEFETRTTTASEA